MFIKTNGNDYNVKTYLPSSESIIIFIYGNIEVIGKEIELFSSEQEPVSLKSIDTADYRIEIQTDTDGNGIIILHNPNYIPVPDEPTFEDIQEEFNLDVDFRLCCLELGI